MILSSRGRCIFFTIPSSAAWPLRALWSHWRWCQWPTRRDAQLWRSRWVTRVTNHSPPSAGWPHCEAEARLLSVKEAWHGSWDIKAMWRLIGVSLILYRLIPRIKPFRTFERRQLEQVAIASLGIQGRSISHSPASVGHAERSKAVSKKPAVQVAKGCLL